MHCTTIAIPITLIDWLITSKCHLKLYNTKEDQQSTKVECFEPNKFDFFKRKNDNWWEVGLYCNNLSINTYTLVEKPPHNQYHRFQQNFKKSTNKL